MRTLLTDRGRTLPGLIPLDDALESLGRDGDLGWRTDDEVPLADVVGSASRANDFDADFRLRNRHLRARLQGVAQAMRAGPDLPPVTLVQLGELYFVTDGHHRVAAARSLGRREITARVHHICTIAYAMCCLRAAHMATKRAERRFLERVPLDDRIRPQLWLDQPELWMRLADAAEAWAARHLFSGRQFPDRRALADAWWHEEVLPVARSRRDANAASPRRDVEVYASALSARDRAGRDDWEGAAACPPE